MNYLDTGALIKRFVAEKGFSLIQTKEISPTATMSWRAGSSKPIGGAPWAKTSHLPRRMSAC